MGGVSTRTVGRDEAGTRLDRWFKRHYPSVGHGQLQKLLRTGQIRIGGRRAKAGDRLAAGDEVRIPPLGAAGGAEKPRDSGPRVSKADTAWLRERVLHRDSHVIVIDKPAGLAVQGGSRTTRHLDGLLDALVDGGERPRLVHRLDRDTSGVLVLARTATAARTLTAAFRGRETRKLYWAAVVGVPRPAEGRIDLPLTKAPGGARAGGREQMRPDSAGKKALTDFRVVDHAGRKAAWLALEPLTGRTHQLRVHLTAIGHPIIGDGKYGGADAFPEVEGIARKLHLHARAISVPHPAGGRLEVRAPLPDHMAATWELLGFDVAAEPDADRWFED